MASTRTAGAGGDQVGGGVGRLLDDVLAVVEDQQRRPVADGGGQVGGRRRIGQGAHGRGLEPEGVADRGQDALAGRDAGQVDHPHRLLGRVGAGEPDLDGQTGLARATGADERDQAVGGQEVVDGPQLVLTTDAPGQGPRQVAGGEGATAAGRPAAAREGSWARMADSSRRSSGPGSMPSSVGQDLAGLLEGPQRLRLPLAAVEGHHELAPEPLPERVGLDQALERLGALGMASEGKVGLDGVLGHGQAQLAEAGPLAGGELVEGEVGQGVPSPQGEGLVQQRGGLRRGAGLEARPPFGHQPLHQQGVDVVGAQVEQVAGGPGDDGLARAGALDRPAQAGHVELQGVGRPLGQLVAVEAVDEAVGADHPARVEGEQGGEGPDPGPAQGHDDAVVVADLERAED